MMLREEIWLHRANEFYSVVCEYVVILKTSLVKNLIEILSNEFFHYIEIIFLLIQYFEKQVYPHCLHGAELQSNQFLHLFSEVAHQVMV
jgi:hypothetical protein